MKENLTRRSLAIFGTGSDVGKSLTVAALCRIFSDLGIKVAPFKAQNMSNNSFVAAEGEMGRAQVVQAQAARLLPEVDMNPVLLKPTSETGSQVVVRGKVAAVTSLEYFRQPEKFFPLVCSAYDRLASRFDLVILEGAGSCAEVNLRERDIVNFPMAHYAKSPVILVADIERGGVFAQIVGTLAVLSEEDRSRLAGIIINRFRGDKAYFEGGISYLEKNTGLPVLGVVPWFEHIDIDSEDSVSLESLLDPSVGCYADKINIACLRLPRISNFTDFAPLARNPRVNFHFLSKRRSLAGYDLVILPGSKNVRSDLEWLAETGWRDLLLSYAAGGGQLAGICGGFQMLGQLVADPHGVEGQPGSSPGLGLLQAETVLEKEKTLSQVTGSWLALGQSVSGYEIHNGVTSGPACQNNPVLISQSDGAKVQRADGAMSADRKIWGSYVHGIFDEPQFLQNLLNQLKPELAVFDRQVNDLAAYRDLQYNLLADHYRAHLDLEKLLQILQQ